MPSTMKQFRLPDESISQLDTLVSITGQSGVDVVKEAIQRLHDSKSDPYQVISRVSAFIADELKLLSAKGIDTALSDKEIDVHVLLSNIQIVLQDRNASHIKHL